MKLAEKKDVFMNVYLAFLIGIVIISFVSYYFYRFCSYKSNKMLKYIPSIVSILSIAFVYLKMSFISQGYEPIIDIVMMIILSCVFVFSLLVAVLIDYMNKKN